MLIKKFVTLNLCLGLLVGCGSQQRDLRGQVVETTAGTTFSQSDLEGLFSEACQELMKTVNVNEA